MIPYRHFQRKAVSLSKRADGGSVVEGYAAVFYRPGDPTTEYEIWPGFVERIMPGAFDRAIREGQDVRGLFNHLPANILGRTVSGTCRLSVDAIGLRYEIDLPDTSIGRDVAVSLERGDIDGSSFMFMPTRTVWIEESERDIRAIEDVDLFDVGPVTFPAYQGTTAGVRSHDSPEMAELWKEYNERRQRRGASEADSVSVALARVRLDD